MKLGGENPKQNALRNNNGRDHAEESLGIINPEMKQVDPQSRRAGGESSMEEQSWRRNHYRKIKKENSFEKSWQRHHEGEQNMGSIYGEKFRNKKPWREIMQERVRTGIMDNNWSQRHPGSLQKAPRRHPGHPQVAGRRLGGTQRHSRGSQQDRGISEANFLLIRQEQRSPHQVCSIAVRVV